MIVSLNSDIWSQNFKHHLDFKTLYTEKLKTIYLGFWSILFNNILRRQNHSQNMAKSRHAKKNLTLRLTFSISNVVFELAITSSAASILMILNAYFRLQGQSPSREGRGSVHTFLVPIMIA